MEVYFFIRLKILRHRGSQHSFNRRGSRQSLFRGTI